MSDTTQTYFALFTDIASDGRCITQTKDPPGQRSVYIPPGDSEKELYRLSTFKNFPQNARINTCQFAKHGFLYTGFKDRVKCFSCGQVADSWMIGDDISLSSWHKPDCKFMNRSDTTNIPIDSFFQQGNRRQLFSHTTAASSSFHERPFSQPRVNNNRDFTTVTYSNTENLSSNITSNSHLPSAANMGSVSSASPTTNVTQSSTVQRSRAANAVETSSYEVLEEEKQRRMLVFPCTDPINPHMRNKESRLQSFLNSESTWPSHRIRASPMEIADSGMYCLDERDRAKCWYCNGGLQNWEYGDDPWEEHAKWFPTCEYLLQQKGPEYVHKVTSKFPNLRRPALYNPSTSVSAAQVLRVVQSGRGSSNHLHGGASSNNGMPVIIDPGRELRERIKKVDQYMESSPLVNQARLMGFEDQAIREALKRTFQANKKGYSTFESLVEAVLALSQGDIAEGSNEDLSVYSESENTPVSLNQLSTSEGLKEMRRLEEARLCKICKHEQSCIVFIPCGHLASCRDCANQVSKCPVCKADIQQKVRSYLS